uniref:Type II toxin-antitoxin system RelE/ParE family toxin n=1 Tax=Rhodopseudomonas palustris (strain DX-1) TaxID=652103 RepID=E6VQE4_RHOPX
MGGRDAQCNCGCRNRSIAGRYAGAVRAVAELIEQIGFEVKHLEERLWELRISDGISRAIYVTAEGRRVVVVRAFVKKTQKTPPRELAIARQRAKTVK